MHQQFQNFKRKLRWLGVVGATSLVLCAPAFAGASDPSTITIDTKNVTKTTNHVTEITNREILNYLYDITGHASLKDNSHGGQVSHWYIERTVSDSEFASALAEIKTLLQGDVYSVPGRTASYTSSDYKTGERFDLVSTTHENVTTGTETNNYQDISATGEAGVDYVTGDSSDPSDWVALNDVTVTVTNTTDIVNFIDSITTEFGNDVTMWQVEVSRLISPLLLDLDGNGAIEASNGNWLPHSKVDKKRLAVFDFYGDKFPVMMEWPGPNDGILCAPKADGSIDGTRMFGTATGFANGYEALRARDANNDGVISGAELEGLAVWTDLNSDAKPQAGEVKSLGEMGITELSVNHKKYVSSFKMNGQNQRMFDWWPLTFELNKVKAAPKKV